MSADLERFLFGLKGRPEPERPVLRCGGCADLDNGDPLPMSRETFYCWGIMTWRARSAGACERFTLKPTKHEMRRA